MAIVFQRAVSATGQSVTIDVGAAGNDRLLVIQVGDESIQTDDADWSTLPRVDGSDILNVGLSKCNPDGIGNSQILYYATESDLGSINGSVSCSGLGIDTGSAVRALLWYGVDDAAPTDTAFNDTAIAPTNPSINIDVPADGLIVYGAGNGSGGGTTGWTSPLTERIDGATNPPSSAVLGIAEAIETSAQTNKQYTVTVGTGTLRSTGLALAFAEAPSGPTSSGAATMGAVEASGAATVVKEASGTPSTPVVEASGAATVVRSASGAATLAAVVATGAAVLVLDASGDATTPAIEASGTATVVRKASGTPSIPAIEADGNASVTGVINANGTPSIPVIEASGNASLTRNASGAATIPAIEGDGNAVVPLQASGAASTPSISASGNAQRIIAASDGSPTVGTPAASGAAVVHRSASGDATIPAIEGAGTASTGAVKSATGAATITAIEASGTAEIQRTAFGAVAVPVIEGIGAANVIKPATGSVSIPAIEATGTAQIFKSVTGAANVPAVTANGVAIVGGVPVFNAIRLVGIHNWQTELTAYHVHTLNVIGRRESSDG